MVSTVRLISALSRRSMRNPNATFSATVMWGKSA